MGKTNKYSITEDKILAEEVRKYPCPAMIRMFWERKMLGLKLMRQD